MRLPNEETLALARQLSRRAANSERSERQIASSQYRLLAAILAGQTQDVLNLGEWLAERARFWEQRGDEELASAFLGVAGALNGG